MADLDAHARAYRDLRARLTTLIASAEPDALDAITPAAPDWRIRDVVAHLSGVCADIMAGNLEGVATDSWTAAQVDARRALPVDEVLAEWYEQGTAVDALIPSFPEPPLIQLLTDAATHEQDIRGALREPGARDNDALALAFPRIVEIAIEPGVAFETDHGRFVSGAGGDVVTTVRAPRFEVFRAMTGRRALDQIRAFDWEPGPRPEAVVISLFTARPTPLVE